MDSVEKECVAFFKTVGKNLGLKDLMMDVFGVLYIEPQEITMDEVATRTGYSLASVSNAVRQMEAIGILERIKKPGSRKIYLYIEKDLVKLNIRKIQVAQENFIRPITLQLPKIIERCKKRAKDNDAKEKLRILENYHRQVKEFEVILQKWRKDLEAISLKVK